MNRTALTLALSASLQLAAGEEPLARTEAFEITHGGKPASTIVIAERPSPAARLAALEIQCHVLKISGAEIPIRAVSERVEGCRELNW